MRVASLAIGLLTIPVLTFAQGESDSLCGKPLFDYELGVVVGGKFKYVGSLIEARLLPESSDERVAIISEGVTGTEGEESWVSGVYLQIYLDEPDYARPVFVDSIEVNVMGEVHYLQKSLVIADANGDGMDEMYYAYLRRGGDHDMLDVRVISGDVKATLASRDPYDDSDMDLLFPEREFASLEAEVQRFAVAYRDRVMRLRRMMNELSCPSREE